MRDSSYLDYCKKLKPGIFDFLKKLKTLNIAPFFDCGKIPPCIRTKKEEEFLKSFTNKINKKYNYNNKGEFVKNIEINVREFPHCLPVVDFTIDKKAIRCFSFSRSEKVDISKFENLKDIYCYFKNRYDTFAYIVPSDEKCRNCYHRITRQCMGSCIAYKEDRINQARNIAETIKKTTTHKEL
jgi:hypothetical protein